MFVYFFFSRFFLVCPLNFSTHSFSLSLARSLSICTAHTTKTHSFLFSSYTQHNGDRVRRWLTIPEMLWNAFPCVYLFFLLFSSLFQDTPTHSLTYTQGGQRRRAGVSERERSEYECSWLCTRMCEHVCEWANHQQNWKIYWVCVFLCASLAYTISPFIRLNACSLNAAAAAFTSKIHSTIGAWWACVRACEYFDGTLFTHNVYTATTSSICRRALLLLFRFPLSLLLLWFSSPIHRLFLRERV